MCHLFAHDDVFKLHTIYFASIMWQMSDIKYGKMLERVLSVGYWIEAWEMGAPYALGQRNLLILFKSLQRQTKELCSLLSVI